MKMKGKIEIEVLKNPKNQKWLIWKYLLRGYFLKVCYDAHNNLGPFQAQFVAPIDQA